MGVPVLLLHHAGGGASDWSEIVERLGPGADALAVDLPGHGARLLEEPLRDVTAMAAFAARAVRARWGRPAIVVGHSMGGAVALQLALDHREAVAGLVLVSTAARLRVATALLDLVREHFQELPQQMAAMGFAPSASPAVAARWLSAPWPASPAAAVADFSACDACDLRPRLPEIGVPAVVMVGEQDLMTPVKRARELVEGMPCARMRVFPDTGHLLIWERPTEVVEEIERMAGGIDPRAPRRTCEAAGGEAGG
ncbi:MAG: alpha/beta hydrolase [Deltaproteobacteria bacterium]|nr:alpha/beta hydrolase [Deltaproteobacteria bacterium]